MKKEAWPVVKKVKKNSYPNAPQGTVTPVAVQAAAENPVEDPLFPIVGIGASAGGLEAFEQFFRQAPADTGLAFVLVPHLDPHHASLLSEILQRHIAMPVVEVQDQMTVAPNCVYVIPPNREMILVHGRLQLSTPEGPRGHRLPIDHFFCSLAADREERAIGIILSGTGSDGTKGVRAIHDQGGLTLAQEPLTAKYDNMPTSAIHSGCVSHVLPVEKMVALLTDLSASSTHQKTRTIKNMAAMHRILAMVRTLTGHDFAQYKKSTIGRRIERRMTQHAMEDWEIYAHYLQEHPTEVQALFKELLINVTRFFRDAEAFVVLKKSILPALLAGKPAGYTVRVWVMGCATGEEVYSIAMVLHEFLDETPQTARLQIFGTDIDTEAIATARAGIYPANIRQDLSAERLNRFFVKEEAGYRIKKTIRENVVFSIQNAIKDPPFTRLDLVCCRNLMIYLEPPLQNRILSTVHYALRPGGVLFLSTSESIGNHHDLFTPLDRKWKFYQTIHASPHTLPGMIGSFGWSGNQDGMLPATSGQKTSPIHFEELSRQMLLHPYVPAPMVIVIPGKAARGKGVKASGKPVRAKELQHMLANRKETLQAGLDEYKRTTDELKSANEELQSANEELQSTNEELETSKEELQSMNEELLAVNNELQAKMEQLAEMQNDLKNLFDNINIGTIFLDEHLVVRRFTREAQRIYRLVSSDVGRFLGDIKSDLDGEHLLAEAQIVIDRLIPYEQEMRTIDGIFYLIRIQPYRTLDNVIEGVVITFTDISKRIQAETAEREARAIADSILDTVSNPLIVLDDTLQIVYANRSFYNYFHFTSEETLGHPIYAVMDRHWNIPALRTLLESDLSGDKELQNSVLEHHFPHLGLRRIALSARRIVSSMGVTQKFLLTMAVSDAEASIQTTAPPTS
ncbi:MAG: PAS domain-containing protein [Magnetococcales bacterium]|nr:PAS domain-containing protein [Magnetococcales bacterium]